MPNLDRVKASASGLSSMRSSSNAQPMKAFVRSFVENNRESPMVSHRPHDETDENMAKRKLKIKIKGSTPKNFQ